MQKDLSPTQLRELDRTAVWHAFSQMAEYDGLIIESGSGPWLFDIEGRRYLDGAGSMWCNLFGHRHAKIDQAVIDQLRRVAHVTNLGMSHPTTIRLAERLISLAPQNLKHVFFAGDGASAVEVAMKMAFQYWRQCKVPDRRRTKFLALGNAYHGDTIGTVSVSGVSRFQSVFEPLLFEVVRGPCPDSFRTPNGISSEDALTEYLAAYRRLFETHAGEIVAMVVEPILQGAAGFVVQPKGFLLGIAALCREFNVILIADEIAVGMGRTGRMFACELESTLTETIQPDFLCIGKGLTGGYLAMSATLTTERVWDAFLGRHEESKTFFHGHTFGGNPLAAAAANAVLDIFEEEEVLKQVQVRGEELAQLLSLLRRHEIVGDVRQVGMMAAVDLVADRGSKTPLPWQDRRAKTICDSLLAQGVWLRPLGNVIPIVPPLNLEPTEMEFLVRGLDRAIAGVG